MTVVVAADATKDSVEQWRASRKTDIARFIIHGRLFFVCLLAMLPYMCLRVFREMSGRLSFQQMYISAVMQRSTLQNIIQLATFLVVASHFLLEEDEPHAKQAEEWCGADWQHPTLEAFCAALQIRDSVIRLCVRCVIYSFVFFVVI